MLFLPSWYPSEDRPLEGSFIREHARAVALVADVTVIYPVESPRPSPVSDMVEGGLRTFFIPYRPGWLHRLTGVRFRWYWHMLKWARRLFRQGYRPDIIHAHVFKAALPAVIIGRRRHIPVMVTEHYSGYATGAITRLDQALARYALNRADLLAPVSAALWQSMEQGGIIAPHRVIPNVYDSGIYYPEAGAVRRKGNSRKKHILFAGNLTPVKGIPTLLQALASLKRNDFLLQMVGAGSQRDEYERLAATLGLEDVVSFRGAMTKEALAEEMRACDFLVLPSQFETFGVVLIEALACGKPVIATNRGGPAEFINSDVGLLVPPGDVPALARAIGEMLDHHGDYPPEKLVAQARSRYTHEAVGRKIQQAYREILDGRGS